MRRCSCSTPRRASKWLLSGRLGGERELRGRAESSARRTGWRGDLCLHATSSCCGGETGADGLYSAGTKSSSTRKSTVCTSRASRTRAPRSFTRAPRRMVRFCSRLLSYRAQPLPADGIRYLSLHDNNYVRYFKGHKKKCVLPCSPHHSSSLGEPRVVSLQMSPQDDTFLSGATDDTVRLWDLRTQNAQVRPLPPSLPLPS